MLELTDEDLEYERHLQAFLALCQKDTKVTAQKMQPEKNHSAPKQKATPETVDSEKPRIRKQVIVRKKNTQTSMDPLSALTLPLPLYVPSAEDVTLS
jgi:hypothetical protein